MEGEGEVVYHLRGQTGRSTVWANGTQKFRTGKFRPRLAFTVLITSINRITTAKA